MFRKLMFVLFALLVTTVVGCSQKQASNPNIAKTYDPRFSATMPIVNDGIILLMREQDYHELIRRDHNTDMVRKDLDAIRARLARRIKGDGLESFSRFILADDSTSRVILLYPECRVVQEPK